jgi:hypothetical protein
MRIYMFLAPNSNYVTKPQVWEPPWLLVGLSFDLCTFTESTHFSLARQPSLTIFDRGGYGSKRTIAGLFCERWFQTALFQLFNLNVCRHLPKHHFGSHHASCVLKLVSAKVSLHRQMRHSRSIHRSCWLRRNADQINGTFKQKRTLPSENWALQRRILFNLDIQILSPSQFLFCEICNVEPGIWI